MRHLFVSSAAAFVEEFHIDGLRVDLTQAIHRDNVLHADGRSLGNVNLFGQKMLREWSRTLQLIRPGVMLIAEDHTGWEAVTQPPDAGGLGFDSTWFAEFYHQLIGDSDMAGGKARLVKTAGEGGDGPLDIEQFAGVLYQSQSNKVVYHESHDEAGNAGGTVRTLVCAVNGAPLYATTRDYAEARCRVAVGLSLLSAGTPMFFMGEETGAQKPYRYNDFMSSPRSTSSRTAPGDGQRQALPLLPGRHPLQPEPSGDALSGDRHHPFDRGEPPDRLHPRRRRRSSPGHRQSPQPSLPRRLRHPDRSLASPRRPMARGLQQRRHRLRRRGLGNFGSDIPASGGRFQALVPANGVLVFQKL